MTTTMIEPQQRLDDFLKEIENTPLDLIGPWIIAGPEDRVVLTIRSDYLKKLWTLMQIVDVQAKVERNSLPNWGLLSGKARLIQELLFFLLHEANPELNFPNQYVYVAEGWQLVVRAKQEKKK